jgi:hypothetical protein
MAIISENIQSYILKGDGVSTVGTINLGYGPPFATFVQAIQQNGSVDVSSNVSSIVLTGSTITVNFVATFSYTVVIFINTVPETLVVSGSVAATGSSGGVMDTVITPATAPTNALATLGVYYSTPPVLTTGQSVVDQTDTTGSHYVNVEGRKATYRAATFSYQPTGSGTQPMLSIRGSATKTIRVTRLQFSIGYTTGLIGGTLLILQRFSVLSGGTPTALTAGSNDINNPAATALVQTWSPLATTATTVGGQLQIQKYNLATEAVGAGDNTMPPYEWQFGDHSAQSIVLRGTSDYFGLMMLSVPTAPLVNFTIEWTEE